MIALYIVLLAGVLLAMGVSAERRRAKDRKRTRQLDIAMAHAFERGESN
jgi:hypothetical protein